VATPLVIIGDRLSVFIPPGPFLSLMGKVGGTIISSNSALAQRSLVNSSLVRLAERSWIVLAAHSWRGFSTLDHCDFRFVADHRVCNRALAGFWAPVTLACPPGLHVWSR
jgi:hypothetical protein